MDTLPDGYEEIPFHTCFLKNKGNRQTGESGYILGILEDFVSGHRWIRVGYYHIRHIPTRATKKDLSGTKMPHPTKFNILIPDEDEKQFDPHKNRTAIECGKVRIYRKREIPKGKSYKHSKGQYFTKNIELKEKVYELIRNNPAKILEPSVGRGDLVDYYNMSVAEFDTHELDDTIEFLPCIKDTVIIGDFMKHSFNKSRYKTIIGNPPFVKTKNGNLYVAFIQKCFDLLEEDGELIFIVPTEFFKLTQASGLIQKMVSVGHFTDVYHPNNEGMFEDASVDVMVFRYCKSIPDSRRTLYNDIGLYMIETNGIITFSKEDTSDGTLLSDIFDISVGLVCGKESVYRNSELGNINVLTNDGQRQKYIYTDSYPSKFPKIDTYLSKHKACLMERKIKKYTEANWFEWGAPRNIKKMKDHKDEKCIYVLGLTRDTTVAFIGKVEYFGGLIMLRPTQETDLLKVTKYLNSDAFRKNYTYSGRFKIGHRQLANTRVVL